MKTFFAPTEQLFSLENRFKIPIAILLACTFFVFLTGETEDIVYYWNAFWFFGGLTMMVMILSFVVYYFGPLIGNGIRLAIASPKFNEAVALLESGLYTGGDFLIRTESPKEPASVIADKLQAKIHEASGEWGVFYQFRNPEALLFQGNKPPLAFDRQSGPPGFPDEAKGEEAHYPTESWQEYENRLKQFFKFYPDWAKDYKWQVSDKTADGFISRARTLYTLAFFLLMSVAMSAQPKSQQVADFLGENRVNMKPIGQVIYRFEKLDIYRDGSGEKKIVDLLKDKFGYMDADNAGQLVSISVTLGGKLVSIVPMPKNNAVKKQEVQPAMPAGNSRKDMQDFVRPHKDTTSRAGIERAQMDPNPEMSFFALEDSATTVARIEAWKAEAAKNGGKFRWTTFKYLDYYIWWSETNLFPWLLICLVIGVIGAWSSAADFVINTFGNTVVGQPIRDIHTWAKLFILFPLIIFGIVEGVRFTAYLIQAGYVWWAIGAVILVFGKRVGRFIGSETPNAPMVSRSGHPVDKKRLEQQN